MTSALPAALQWQTAVGYARATFLFPALHRKSVETAMGTTALAMQMVTATTQLYTARQKHNFSLASPVAAWLYPCAPLRLQTTL